MFLNALFWNIGHLTDYSILRDLCENESIDILMTAEDLSPHTLKEINLKGSNFRPILSTTKRGLKFYSRHSAKVESAQDDRYYSAKFIKHPRIGRILIILVHFPSKIHMSSSDQKCFISKQISYIENLEKRLKTQNTIVIGDFNFNPHEESMLSADGLNAVCCSTIAQKVSRTVKGTKYKFFYNPMWNFYTKNSGEGHGTCYWNPPGYTSIYWNIFDQAIFRPQLIDNVKIDIIDKFRLANSPEISLLKIADHLPIKLTIEH